MEEEDYIKESDLPFQPKPISLKEMEILGNLAKSHICKIKCKNGSHGTGFFCNIPIGWNDYLKVFMTNNHVLDINDIQPGQIINFSLDNDYKDFQIIIDNSRETYTNKDYDVTIIEIKKEDKIDEKSFFDLDKQIFKENAFEIFRNNQIYLLHYPKGEELVISPGVIKSITIDNKTIQHLCSSSGGSSGSPIINKNNYQVIGIHKGSPASGNKYNLGTLLKEPLENFNEEVKIKKNQTGNNKDNNINKNNKENKKIVIEEKKEIKCEEKEKNEKKR